MIIERVDALDELAASVVRAACDDLRRHDRHFWSAVVFLDQAGLLRQACRARGIAYERCVDALIAGPLKRRGR